LRSKVNLQIHFAFKFSLRCLQPDIVPIISTGVIDTGGEFAATTLVKLVAKFAACVFDTGGKFATSIDNTSKTCGKICHLYC
jgi:hypothetical protein